MIFTKRIWTPSMLPKQDLPSSVVHSRLLLSHRSINLTCHRGLYPARHRRSHPPFHPRLLVSAGHAGSVLDVLHRVPAAAKSRALLIPPGGLLPRLMHVMKPNPLRDLTVALFPNICQAWPSQRTVRIVPWTMAVTRGPLENCRRKNVDVSGATEPVATPLVSPAHKARAPW